MPDYGLLGGIGVGLQNFATTYLQAKQMADQNNRYAEEMSMRKKELESQESTRSQTLKNSMLEAATRFYDTTGTLPKGVFPAEIESMFGGSEQPQEEPQTGQGLIQGQGLLPRIKPKAEREADKQIILKEYEKAGPGKKLEFDPSTRGYKITDRPLTKEEEVAQLSKSEELAGKKLENDKKRRELSKPDKDAFGQKELPPDKILTVQQGQLMPQMLTKVDQVIDNNADMFGPIVGRLNSANVYNSDAQAVDAEMRAASQSFGRYMEGGVLRKEDEEKYRKMFPQLSDTPETAKKKLAVVKNLLESKQSGDVGALKQSGFNMSAFEGQSPQGLPPPNMTFEQFKAWKAKQGKR